jgi:hypothetical protein
MTGLRSMLKYGVGLLVLLNAAVLAWQWDTFAPWGYSPQANREPERLQQQLRPEALKLLVTPPAQGSAAPSETPADAEPTGGPQPMANPGNSDTDVTPSSAPTATGRP